MTSIPSTNRSPWFQEDKNTLNLVCLDSFVTAFQEVKPTVFFLLDHTSEDTDELLNHFPFMQSRIKSESGINQTMLDSYRIASEAEGLVLFQECDYLWRPDTGKLFVQAIEELGLVSPYDHLNFYKDPNIHSSTCEIELVGNHHFRTTERNTMTWGCRSDTVRECYDTLIKYGYLDDLVWQDLRFAGHQLWVPVPSMATHCVENYLAPGVDWGEILGSL